MKLCNPLVLTSLYLAVYINEFSSLPGPRLYPFITPGAFPWCRHLLELAALDDDTVDWFKTTALNI